MEKETDDIYRRLVEIISEYSGQEPRKISPRDRLSRLGIDSFDRVEITFELELELDCDFSVPYETDTVGEFAKALFSQWEKLREGRKTDA